MKKFSSPVCTFSGVSRKRLNNLSNALSLAGRNSVNIALIVKIFYCTEEDFLQHIYIKCSFTNSKPLLRGGLSAGLIIPI